MGEFQRRLDNHEHMVATEWVDLWLAEFVFDYSEAHPRDKHDVVRRWFG